MTLLLGDYTLDYGLAGLQASCDSIYVCSASINSFADLAGNTLASQNFGAGNAFGVISDGSPDGRIISSTEITDCVVSVGGTATSWAAVDSVNSRVLASGDLLNPVSINANALFSLASFTIHVGASLEVIGANISVALSSAAAATAFVKANLAAPAILSAAVRTASLATARMLAQSKLLPAGLVKSNMSVIGGGGGGPTIPMSWNDARFAGNTKGTAGQTFGSGTVTNTDWNENPAYGSGDQCCTWNGPGTLNMTQCRVDWREGPRIAADSGTLNVDQCFISCVGKSVDHADGIQAYDPGGGPTTINVTNTCFRSYSDAEAAKVYGSGFIGSDAWFWADSYQGTIVFDNVLIWGGARGVSIYADVGTTTIKFNNVYFVLGNGDTSWEFYDYDIKPTGGKLVVGQWTNVYAATIVNGVIVPQGSLLPSPPT